MKRSADTSRPVGIQRPASAAEAVKSALRAFGLTDEISKTFEAWDALPADVRAGAEMTSVGRGAIFLVCPSAASMHKIFYNKNEIIAALNRRLGEKYVREVKVELGRPKKGK